MKNSTKKITGFVLMVFMFLSIPQEVSAISDTNTSIIIVKDDLVGGWEYTVAGAPEGYDSGLLMIVKANDTYRVQVQTAGGVMNGNDIVVKKNTITFKLMVEDESVSVELTAKGSQLTGTSTSSSGVYAIKGTKSISPQ